MVDDGRPIAWLALEEGTEVVSRDGKEIGKISQVVGDVTKDIFSGIAFRPGILQHPRFAPADLVDAITTESVRLSITSEEAERLDDYRA
jgi:sporulation protein YlmC with PRC-barrel domain